MIGNIVSSDGPLPRRVGYDTETDTRNRIIAARAEVLVAGALRTSTSAHVRRSVR